MITYPKLTSLIIGVFAATILWFIAEVIVFESGLIQLCPIYEIPDGLSAPQIVDIERELDAACRERTLIFQAGLWLVCYFIVHLLIVRWNKERKCQ